MHDLLLNWLVSLDSVQGISSIDFHNQLTCRMECDICHAEPAPGVPVNDISTK